MKASIQGYFDGLSADHRQISLRVRQEVLTAIPEVQESLKWKVPYYMFKGPIGYLTVKEQTVMFGFFWGKLMEDSFNAFEKNGLKQVRQFAFPSMVELRMDVFRAYLYESIEINERVDKPKYSAKRRKE